MNSLSHIQDKSESEIVENWAAIADDLVGELCGSAAWGGETNCFDPKALKKIEEDPQEGRGKRPGFIWTDERHQIFVHAVDSLTLQSNICSYIYSYV